MPEIKSTDSDRGSAMYDLGSTTIFASRGDARFSYCLYVPPGFATAATVPELIVAMHGTGRSFLEYRNALAEFGRWNNCIILAPLFPVGVRGDGTRRCCRWSTRSARNTVEASTGSPCSAIPAAAISPIAS